MTNFGKKCDAYNSEVESNRKLIKFFGLIVWAPAILLAVLGIALVIITGIKHVPYFYATLVLVLVAGIYLLVMRGVLKNKFDNNNRVIVDKFIKYYKVASVTKIALIVKEDNLGKLNRINQYGPNSLFVYQIGESLYFVTSAIPSLTNLSLKGSVSDEFEKILAKDFGVLIIPIADIDNYKDNTLMVTYGNTVMKTEFKDHDFLDKFVPTKDFYFNADKK